MKWDYAILGENKMAEKKDNHRIVIYGAGAVGGVIGGLLALSCTPVLLIGRPGNVEVILKHGLRIVTQGNSHNPGGSCYHAKPNKVG